jgi:hypothetical protein
MNTNRGLILFIGIIAVVFGDRYSPPAEPSFIFSCFCYIVGGSLLGLFTVLHE